jgi:DNA recombination protein RmuC
MLFYGEGKSNMLTMVVVLQALVLIAIAVLVWRTRTKPEVGGDPRLSQIPDQLARVDARAEALDANVRAGLAQMRAEVAAEANASRQANAEAGAALRTEITRSVSVLGTAIQAGLDSFRIDNKSSAEGLRTAIQQSLDGLAQRLSGFISDSNRHQIEAQSALHAKLTELGGTATREQERLRTVVQERLDHLNTTNAAKLEEMRLTVDEKLHATLHSRLTESFGQVTDQLNKVHTGLGEMSKLSEGVDDLSRIFTNVKSRGGFAEVQLGMLLEQMLAPSQFLRNAKVKPNTQEVVEFAVRFPGHTGETLRGRRSRLRSGRRENASATSTSILR